MIVAPALILVGYAFMGCLVVRAVFSWFEPYPKNPLHKLTFDITEPILAPVRRHLPPMAGFDLSFAIVFAGLWLLVGLLQQAGG
ncbi:MAG TPA: YggT family protein [Candidatus Acidoferrales bacterium]|nr:YggT family protein [Candidatus Acidoferrales bacterium]